MKLLEEPLQKAKAFLEYNILTGQNITDTYGLAITSYALAKLGSTQAPLALSKLNALAKEKSMHLRLV